MCVGCAVKTSKREKEGKRERERWRRLRLRCRVGGSVAANDGEADALPEPAGLTLFPCLGCDATSYFCEE